MSFVNYNGKILPADDLVLPAQNKSYRYGDGLFETIKVKEGKALLFSLHIERLFDGMNLLGYTIPRFFTPAKIEEEIATLCKKNDCLRLGRVRISVSRGTGGLYDGNDMLQYLIECWPLNDTVNSLNENGLVIDTYDKSVKSCDVFSNLKSASCLPYVMAAQYAKQNKLNDCLLVNQYGRICDATIANVFWIKDDCVYTPPLSEGCVAGIIRKWLLNALPGAGYTVLQKPCTIADLENADEIFLTNAINGMRWVKQFRNKIFHADIIQKIYRELF